MNFTNINQILNEDHIKQKMIYIIQQGEYNCQEGALVLDEYNNILRYRGQEKSVTIPMQQALNAKMVMHNHPNKEKCGLSTSTKNRPYEDIYGKYSLENFSGTDMQFSEMASINVVILGYEKNGVPYIGYINKEDIREAVYYVNTIIATRNSPFASRQDVGKAIEDYYQEVNKLTYRLRLR